MKSFARKTLASPVHLAGRGLHTGVAVNLTIHPGDQGIAFRYGGDRIPARPDMVTDTTRSTKLGPVGTVEHLMSAFAGLEITDAEVEVDAPEIPGVDGSAAPFVAALLAAGLEGLGEREVQVPYTRLFLQEDEGLKGAVAKGEGHWRYVYDAGARWPGSQAFELDDVVATYATDIAPARTFAFAEEILAILQMGLAQGLDEHSALILGPDGYQNEARFPDEPARHKLLDVIGDLYLAGVPLRALSVVVEKTGHRANVKLAQMLFQATHDGP